MSIRDMFSSSTETRALTTLATAGAMTPDNLAAELGVSRPELYQTISQSRRLIQWVDEDGAALVEGRGERNQPVDLSGL